MSALIAFDPGASGGVVFQRPVGWHPQLECMPIPADPDALVQRILAFKRDHPDCTAIIEEVPKYIGVNLPGSSVAVLFTSYGYWRGVLAGQGIPTILVRPHDWQKGYNLGTRRQAGSHAAWKRRLKDEACRLFPALGKSVTLKTADALLILEYARTSARQQS